MLVIRLIIIYTIIPNPIPTINAHRHRQSIAFNSFVCECSSILNQTFYIYTTLGSMSSSGSATQGSDANRVQKIHTDKSVKMMNIKSIMFTVVTISNTVTSINALQL